MPARSIVRLQLLEYLPTVLDARGGFEVKVESQRTVGAGALSMLYLITSRRQRV